MIRRFSTVFLPVYLMRNLHMIIQPQKQSDENLRWFFFIVIVDKVFFIISTRIIAKSTYKIKVINW